MIIETKYNFADHNEVEYYKIGLLFGSVCVFVGILELFLIILNTIHLPYMDFLGSLQFVIILSFSASAIAIGSILIGKICKKPLLSVFICGECNSKFQDQFDLRRHYLGHLMKQ
jgi:hypothetical protein